MKRGDIIMANEQVPFASDLIFYAPLTQGDLTDHISGAVGTPYSENGTIYSDNLTWDTIENAYKFHTNKMYQHGARFSVPNFAELISTIHSDDTIWCCDVKCSNQNCCYALDIGYAKSGDTGNRDYGYTPAHLVRVGSFVFDNDWHHVVFGFNYSAHEIWAYVDKILRENTTSYAISSKVFKPNWTNNMKKYISLGVNQDSYQGEITMWIKDMRLYNRDFTTAELASL